ncbi:molybdopterin cofactor-binding domain-containing protein [Gloeocapsopsis sp. IPPAS B-1203]|uniref:molybdopterin-dependent oxidoreductase n=1 Tax=Gloeocapsopsis sp. IPPAS B-1203 TaxID=2049454 RepID=UPI000C192278|nr:molybdopterin cofactor-binding domain-containing protein [Gloeocapsopsis sp. IPPAS B-1203]PIG94011.1 carbon monoxide dehydrogenase [Gloeocapsopsis sp. IPPAS B-1203]
MQEPLTFQVNGKTYTESCPPGTSLLTLLRDLGWVGVHRVCESGDCGSCTVWVDDKPVHSCIYPVMKLEGHDVTTIEGLAADELAPIQQAFLEKQGFQCGFCTPGMIMSAAKLQYTSLAELRQALDGNLCRCTGYEAILESILAAKEQRSQPCIVQNPVGKSVPKQDGPAIVKGTADYTADWSPPGLLHMKAVRSPHPHARIRQINTEKAQALPGVHAVFTYEDVPRKPYTTAGHADPVPDPLDHYLLDHKVRFIGDRVAAVVAESVAIAIQACQLIEVDYEILPHVIDPLAAINDCGIVIHDEPESSQIYDAQRNIAAKVMLGTHDIAQGFAEADLIVENTYHLPAVQHVHLEPHISTSWLEADGTLVVRSSTQVPFHTQRVLAQLFNLPQDKVRVFKTQIGGGFGNKQEILTEDLCVLATLHTGKPVQWEFTREEEFTATNSRHAMQVRVKTGVKADGTLVAQEMEAIANTGAYGNHAPTVVFLTGCYPLGLYRCPHQRFLGLSVYTNTMPAGAFRGYGATQGTFAVESQMDEIAEKLGIDPIELRQKNIIQPQDIIRLGREGAHDHFHLIGSYGVPECFAKVTQALNYVPGTKPTVNEHLRRGVGFAVSMQGSGLAKIHSAGVKLSLTSDGYELRTGAIDVGTGADTSLRQIAAQVLGVTVADIELIAGDTHHTPFDAGSYASATTYISGKAVNKAAVAMRSQILEFAAKVLDTQLENITLTADKAIASQQEITLQELVSHNQQPFVVEVEHAANESSLTFAVQGAEVEVDTETGRITVLRCVQAIDVGTAINPRICHGQATGGIVMGLGYALSEELIINESGRILNPALRTYRLPTAKDTPQMEIILVEQPDPYGPFGAKGIGEIGTNCTAAAIANAVAHATGVRLTQIPMTPERVWQALNA